MYIYIYSIQFPDSGFQFQMLDSGFGILCSNTSPNTSPNPLPNTFPNTFLNTFLNAICSELVQAVVRAAHAAIKCSAKGVR